VPGISDLDQLLRTEVSRLPGVQRLVTTVCMKTIKHRSPLIGCLR
jgi:Lrp/AsnC family leucine-responsive transcriptional regulator